MIISNKATTSIALCCPCEPYRRQLHGQHCHPLQDKRLHQHQHQRQRHASASTIICILLFQRERDDAQNSKLSLSTNALPPFTPVKPVLAPHVPPQCTCTRLYLLSCLPSLSPYRFVDI